MHRLSSQRVNPEISRPRQQVGARTSPSRRTRVGSLARVAGELDYVVPAALTDDRHDDADTSHRFGPRRPGTGFRIQLVR